MAATPSQNTLFLVKISYRGGRSWIFFPNFNAELAKYTQAKETRWHLIPHQ